MFPPVDPGAGNDRRKQLLQMLMQRQAMQGRGGPVSGLPVFGGLRPALGLGVARGPLPNFTQNPGLPSFVTPGLGAAVPRGLRGDMSPGYGQPVDPGMSVAPGQLTPIDPNTLPTPYFPTIRPSPGDISGGFTNIAPAPPPGDVSLGGGVAIDPITQALMQTMTFQPVGGGVSGLIGGGRAV